jgi:lipopolysaccharide biosynthesis glycosyltransferase
MKRSYNIVTACDDAFAQHTTVMLASLLSRHQECSFQVFILVPSDFLEETASKIIASFGANLRPKIIRVSDEAVSELKVDGHITKAAYFRLRIGELLPATLERVLYLDPDIIITGDVTELFETDLLDFPFGAVPDLFVEVYRREIRAKIELSESADYFNDGVLLIDLPRWRSLNIGARAITYCRLNRDAITFHEQCALNHVANGRFYILDEKWNFQTNSVFQTDSSAQLRSAKIVHFTGELKPWHFLCTHPLKHLYFESLRTTAWTDFKVHWTHRDLIKRILGPTMSRAAVAAARRIRIWPGP